MNKGKEIDLLKRRKEHGSFIKDNIQLIRIVSMVLLTVVSFFSIILFISIALSPLPSLQEQEKNEKQVYATFSPIVVKIMIIKERIQDIKTMMQKRTGYTTTVRELYDLLAGDAVVDALRLHKKTVNITISSSNPTTLNDYMERLLKKNEGQKLFKKIMLEKMMLNTTTKRYVLVLDLVKI